MRWNLGEAYVDLSTRTVRWADRELELTTQEAALLRHLARRPGEPASRGELLTEVWGYAHTSRSRAVDHTVHRLREKLEAQPDEPRFLLTVRGLGYRLALPTVSQSGERAEGLVGRAALLEELERAIDASGQLTVVGPAGIGKTALTIAWAQRHDVPVARLAEVDPAGLAEALSAQLAVPIAPGVSEGLALDRIGRALLGRSVPRVVLDDVDAVAPAVRHLVDVWGRLGLRVIVTCQVPLGVAAESVVRVPPLDETASAMLLLGDGSLPRRDSALHDLLEGLGGHPLSLLMASAQLKDVSAEVLAEVVVDPLAEDAARAAVRRGVERLDSTTKEVLHLLSLGPDIPLSAVGQAMGLPMRHVHDILGRLSMCALVEPGPRVPELVRRSMGPVAPASSATELADVLLRGEHPPLLLAAVAGRLENVDDERASELWRAACRPMLLRGPVQLRWADRAVTCSTGEALAEALALRGALATLTGDLEQAQEDLSKAEPKTEKVAIEWQIRRGWLALLRGRHPESEASLRDALRRSRRAGEPGLEAMAEVRLASLTHRLGQVPKAVRHLRRALGLYGALQNDLQVSRTRSNLAMMQLELGHHAEARDHLEAALAADRAAGVWAAVPQHLLNLGGLLLDQGELEEASVQLEDARSEAVRFGDRETEGLALLSLGVLSMLEGVGDGALTPISRGRTLLQETQNVVGAGIGWAYEALACGVADAPAEGEDALDEARRRLEGLGVPALTDLLDVVAQTLCFVEGGEPDWDDTPSALSFVRVAQRVRAAEVARRAALRG